MRFSGVAESGEVPTSSVGGMAGVDYESAAVVAWIHVLRPRAI